MYSDKMMEMFVRNQLFLNPNYDGEILMFNGISYDLTKIAHSYHEQIKTRFSNNRNHEVLCSYLLNNDDIIYTMQDTRVTLRDIIYNYRIKLPVKKQADNFIENHSQGIYNFIREFLVKPNEFNEGVIGSNLILDSITVDDVKTALSTLLGINSCRPIFLLTRGSLNGNVIDFMDKDMSKLGKIKEPITSYSNLLRCVGIPYSDYRQFLSTGALVSISLDDYVMIIKDEFAYCCTVEVFHDFISDNSKYLQWKESYAQVYHPELLVPGTKLKWELPIK